MRISCLLLATLAVVAFDASAKKPCEEHYVKNGGYLSGRQFSSWDVAPNVAPADALKRIHAEGVKSGLKVANIDRELGSLSFEQVASGSGGPVNLPWNVLIEPEGTGSKITVAKTTPPGYATSEDFQIKSMCAVIEAGQGTPGA